MDLSGFTDAELVELFEAAGDEMLSRRGFVPQANGRGFAVSYVDTYGDGTGAPYSRERALRVAAHELRGAPATRAA